MSEINREFIEYFNKRIEKEKQIINLPTCDKEVAEQKKKHIAYFEQAISDREKLEKIEHILFDIEECNELAETFEEKIEKICNQYNHNCDSCMVSRMKQIVKG